MRKTALRDMNQKPPAIAGSKGRRGITFLEIMVVMVILGVLIAVSTANLRGTGQRSALIGAARELVAGCNVARQSAISSEREVTIKFDINGDRWKIQLNVPEEEEDKHAHYDRDAVYDLEMPHQLPPKISFTQMTTEAGKEARGKEIYPLVTFFPDGTATGASIEMQNEKGRKMTVEVAHATGRCEVYEGEPKTFVEKLKSLGVKPAAFGAEPTPVPGQENSDKEQSDDPNAARKAREQEQREHYYQDVVSRIMEAHRQARPQPRGPGGPSGPGGSGR